MSNYELLCILSGKIAETEVASFEKAIEDVLKNNASTVHFTHHLDRKKLAYPIDGHTYGYYFLAEFDAENEAVSTIKRELSLMNDVLRTSLAVKKQVGKPPVMERKQSFDALPSMDDGLTDMPLEQVAPVVAQVQTPTPSAPVQPVQQKPVQPESSAQVEASAPVEVPQQTTSVSTSPTQEEVVEQEAVSSSSKDKKKQVKLSYEELDKKLDEIINNDIF